MRPRELRESLNAEPFTPIRVCLFDGQSVLIRHPDQAAVSDRVLFVGLAKVGRTRPTATPRRGDTIAKDWTLVSLLHIATVEPVNGAAKRSNGKRPKR